MIVCNCKNISEGQARKVLSESFQGITIITKRQGDGPNQTTEPNNLDDLHKACSGSGFNCGKCACHLATIASEHNRQTTMDGLTAPLKILKTVSPETEPV